MKMGIVTRKNESKWGGDLTALYCFYEGLKAIGQDVTIAKTVEELLHTDFIFLSNTSFDLKEDYALVEKHKKKFGVIGFHSDRLKYYSPCYAFANFIGLCLAEWEGISFYSIDQLLENPDITQFFSYSPSPIFEENYPILEKAELCVATSQTEAATLQRDSPGCRAKVIPLECGIPNSFLSHNSPAFLEWTGLKKGEYILQVGRLELRKNQLASILSTRNLEIPLVFIATESVYPNYVQLCLKAIQKWRKAPTLIVSQDLKSCHEGNLRILQMPNKSKLPLEMLVSAYQNAGLYLHPAFCELPGLTYLEAAKLGVPIIASEWTTILDYFTDPVTNTSTLSDQILYSPPHHINHLTNLILQQFGRTFEKPISHPIFHRTKIDVANDLIAAMRN